MLATIMSFVLILENSIPSLAAQNMFADSSVSQNQYVELSEIDCEKEEIVEAALLNTDSADEECGNEIVNIDYVKAEEEARQKLKEKTEKKDIYALVYLTDNYAVKKRPDTNAETTTYLKSADTVRISDFALEWVMDYGECIPTIWFLAEFYEGELLQQGYIEEEYLAYSDELLKEWKQEFCQLFELDEVSAFGDTIDDLDVKKFPYSYRIHLEKLKQLHPNWIFVPMNVNRDWNACVTEQLGDYSWISYNQPAEYLGAKINSSWHYASTAGIAYYMDPRNFLTESNIFMFEQNTYNASYHTQSALQQFLSNTFMKGIIPDDSQKRTYANVIFNSGKTRGLSPFNLAARVIQEQGVNGNSQMISGTYPGYEGYYNFYNIQAGGSTNTEVYINGLSYAKSKGWNTRAKSLDGGAAFIGNGYILKGQDTLYLQKFDILHEGSLHQYMQNIMAPYTEGRSMRSMYQNAGSLNSDFVFKIPVFLNMPSGNPLKGISFASAETELFLIENNAEQIPMMDENGKTVYVQKNQCPLETDIQVIYEAQDATEETTDNKAVTWKVQDESVLSLTPDDEDISKARITALKGGNTKVTAKVGKFQAVMEVRVRVPMTEAELEQKELILYQGQKTSIPVTYSPLNTTEDSFVAWWCSKDEAGKNAEDRNLLSVDDGMLFAVNSNNSEEVTTYVHARIGSFDGTQKKLTCKVTIRPYDIVFKNEKGETIFKATGAYGETFSEIENRKEVEFPWKQTKNEYVFLGWYSQKNGQGHEITPETILQDHVTAYPYFEKITDGFFVKPISPMQYTGGKIKPEVQIYDAEGKLWTQDKDYQVNYRNNIEISGNKEGNKPTVIISAMEKEEILKEIFFEIVPRDIFESTVTASDFLLSYTGTMQKALPHITDGNRTLQKEKDYVLEYPAKNQGAYVEAGVYPVNIIGKGNYTGEQTIYITITKRRLLKDAVLEKIKAVNFSGGEDCIPVIKLTYGKDILTENVDYTVTYQNQKQVGTASAIITGIGNYAGSRIEKYSIVGTEIEKCKLIGIEDKEYSGVEVVQNGYLVCDEKGNVLKENIDYEVRYRNNLKTGNARMVIKGIGSFQGERIEVFQILPYDIEKYNTRVEVSELAQSYVYDKMGVKPEVKVTFQGKTLKKNVDYTLQYRNNENISIENSSNKPVVLVIGKGNFTGKIQREFVIEAKDMQAVSMSAKDIYFQNKKSFCFAEPILKETSSGGILIKGKDYASNYRYEYDFDTTLWDGSIRKAGETVQVTDVPMPGTVIRVMVSGIGNYQGNISCTYKIKEAKQEMQGEIEEARKEALEQNNKQNDNGLLETAQVEEMQAETSQSMITMQPSESVEEVEKFVQKSQEGIENLKKEEITIKSFANPEVTQKNYETKDAESMKDSEQPTGKEDYEAEGKLFKTIRKEEKGIVGKQGDSLKSNRSMRFQVLQALGAEMERFPVLKTKGIKIFLLLGCCMGISCVMIVGRKRKKEEKPFGKKV